MRDKRPWLYPRGYRVRSALGMSLGLASYIHTAHDYESVSVWTSGNAAAKTRENGYFPFADYVPFSHEAQQQGAPHFWPLLISPSHLCHPRYSILPSFSSIQSTYLIHRLPVHHAPSPMDYLYIDLQVF